MMAEPVVKLGVWERAEFRIPLQSGLFENPFTEVTATGQARLPDGSSLIFDGFCDSAEGSEFAFRYLPLQPGLHSLTLKAAWEGGSVEKTALVEAEERGLPGILRAKGWGFEWSGTGEPFFWNSTTAYMMAGLSAEALEKALTRLAEQGINRLRVALCPSRQKDGGRWMEPQVKESDAFTFCFSPWLLKNPDKPLDPQPMTDRFDLKHWKKMDSLIQRAGELGIQVQIIFFVDGQEPQNYPFDRESKGDDPLETIYLSYAAARLASYANVDWCLTNEWASFRPDEWVEARGRFFAEKDAYSHLLSVHGHGHFPFRASPWCTHALFQVWDEHGAGAWAKSEREKMLEAGFIKPIINEENGYEDHYPCPWGEGREAPSRDWETRARLAWELVMSGAWGTVGESARETGGWINGYGEGEDWLFSALRHLRDFCQLFDLNKAEPASGVSSGPTFCRTDGSSLIAVWAPYGGPFSVKLPHSGPWQITAFDPWSGETETVAAAQEFELDPYINPGWSAPSAPWGEAKAWILRSAIPV